MFHKMSQTVKNAYNNLLKPGVIFLDVFFRPTYSLNPKVIQFTITIKQRKKKNLPSWAAGTMLGFMLEKWLKLRLKISALIQSYINYYVQQNSFNPSSNVSHWPRLRHIGDGHNNKNTCTIQCTSPALFTESVKQRLCSSFVETVSKRWWFNLAVFEVYRRGQNTMNTLQYSIIQSNTATPQTRLTNYQRWIITSLTQR